MLCLRLSNCRPFQSPCTRTKYSRGYRHHCAAQHPNAERPDVPSPSGRSFGDSSDQSSLGKMPYGAICALSSLGLAETLYLTAAKLSNATVACPLSGGCASVLTSDYANFMGVVPLPVLGMLAYGGMTFLAAQGIRFSGSLARPDAEDRRFRTALLTLGAVMASCSGYLMYLLATKFSGEVCPWCVASAALSFSIAGLAASGMGRRELAEAAGPELGLAATTLLLLSVGLGTPGSSEAGDLVLTYKEPVVTTESSSHAVDLARRLSDAGARMYGAFWCSHCFDQKEDFGAAAMRDFPYVECFPIGWQKGVQMAAACQEAGLEGFPTWVIGNQKLKGEQTFEALEEALTRAMEDVAAVAVP